MDERSQKNQFDTIRDRIDKVLKINPDNLHSEELLQLTCQIDKMFIEQIRQSG